MKNSDDSSQIIVIFNNHRCWPGPRLNCEKFSARLEEETRISNGEKATVKQSADNGPLQTGPTCLEFCADLWRLSPQTL